jgi:hypothetical protein
MTNSLIYSKRENLVRFIREQTLGPGISGYRFLSLDNPLLESSSLTKAIPLHNEKELIDVAPATVYSTGILFPEDKSKGTICTPNRKATNDGESDPSDDNTNNEIDEDNEDVLSPDQMYPNSMGLSCCLSKDVLTEKKLYIKVYARTYRPIEGEKQINSQYGVLLEQDPSVFYSILQKFTDTDILRTKLRIRKGTNNIIFFENLDTHEVAIVKTRIREVDRQIALELGAKPNQVLSGFKEFLSNNIKNKKGKEQTDDIKKIQNIEDFENAVAHINSLLNIYAPRGFGLYEATLHSIEVPLPEDIPLFEDIKGKKIYTYNKYVGLKDIVKVELETIQGKKTYVSLSLNLQFSKNSRIEEDKIYLKVQLVNTSTPFEKTDNRFFSVANEIVNQRSLFGVGISVQSPELLPYRTISLNTKKGDYTEEEITQHLYRQYEDFGIGHGCSVKWDAQNKIVETEYIPITDLPDVDPIPRNKNKFVPKLKTENRFEPEPYFQNAHFLEFKWLSSLSAAADNDIIIGLNQFVDTYGDWIESNRKRDINKINTQILDACTTDQKRIKENIKTILLDATNLRLFRLMNTAMFMQLWHSVKAKEGKVNPFFEKDNFNGFDTNFYKNADDKLFGEDSAAWRPFQLAFILLNLDGIIQSPKDEHWTKRNEWVDLVWFPTGGGKTEAYLGLIALTILNRRYRYKTNGGGTAVLMRYTLRLLTTQQFQRASMLIMALEILRRYNPTDFGKEPINIGLWVGDNSLPNKLVDLVKEFDKQYEKKSNKIPFKSCPWCNTSFESDERFYKLKNEREDRNKVFEYNRVHFYCADYNCAFGQNLNPRTDHGAYPISLCDEEIYQHPPALLFGTVDKFAQLAHKVSNEDNERHKDSRRIFGKGNFESGKPRGGYLPPDMIIQDELHLLLGPLGSSVALFEAAVDQLCTRVDGTRPKVISSTATTRNTPLQIMALFNRHVNLFPKSGIDCDDSFFAFYKRETTDKNGEANEYLSQRRYMGLMPTGRTSIWMQMRLVAICLTHRAIFQLEQLEDKHPIDFDYSKEAIRAIDFYHSVISYFNSLKEVGKTESQIHTYLIKEVRRVFNRVLRPGKLMHFAYTYSINEAELTGRLSGEEVVEELNKVSTKWQPNQWSKYNLPPDFIIATNMISVGIDVARFNTIIMNSMSRNIAEYIQASSRVARNDYGLVITLHHPFKARDVSHYERFTEFHEKMYSYVEPISITPFTQKALNRYLGLYFATMLRHTITGYINRNTATNFRTTDKIRVKKELIEYFSKRKNSLQNSDYEDFIKNLITDESIRSIDEWIDNVMEDWLSELEEADKNNKILVFNNPSPNQRDNQKGLYVPINEYEGNIHSEKWQIPQSLRSIEPEAVINIKTK